MSGATPLTGSGRLTELDTLRGVAVLGILFMNVQLFAMPQAAYLNPTAYGDLTGANWIVWLAGRLFFDQKFMTIFSLLFGAGIVLFAARAEQHGDPPARLHYRRMAWLLAIGLLHAYGLWIGDILVTYALCGMLVYPLWKRAPRTQLAAGLTLVATGSAIWVFFGATMSYWPPEAIAALELRDWRPPPDLLAREVAIYQGGWWRQMEERVPAAFGMQTFEFLIWGVWRAGGLMLVGMGLYRLGFLTGTHPRRTFVTVIAVGLLAGMSMGVYGVYQDVAAGWSVRYSFFLGSQWNYWGSLFMSAAYIALVRLALAPAGQAASGVPPGGSRAGVRQGVAARFAAVGRMAFTNYLLQTMICTTIFYGHGLGWFGQVSRGGQALIVVAVWILLLVVSPVWLRRFQFGPVEWLWRALTYAQRPPFRRPASATPGAAVSA